MKLPQVAKKGKEKKTCMRCTAGNVFGMACWIFLACAWVTAPHAILIH